MPLKRGIELIVGPMFCGKTEELLRRLRRIEVTGKKFQLFKPTTDNRYSENHVSTHNGSKMEGNLVENTFELIKEYDKRIKVIGIDEFQFFDDQILEFILDKQYSHLFILSGLALNFRGEPFNFKNSKKHMGNLMPYARITSLNAICNKCGEDNAEFTQRLINGKPASYDSPLILVGGSESYEARCLQHFYKPIKGEENKFLVKGKRVVL
ncbi:thymidine kinase [Nanoarchaeota archaeon]